MIDVRPPAQVRRPDLFILDETEGDPMIVIGLPLETLRAVIKCVYMHGTPADGLAGVVDELQNQLLEQKEELGIED